MGRAVQHAAFCKMTAAVKTEARCNQSSNHVFLYLAF